ncbi:hypothetical protein BHE74_00033636 [Ensete ventricosum]|nr:hypothetical protein BHE74_00033636 [Ensete ventricosum]RZS14920.1 hypothetical protein BHM03_00046684 [Ensete ventricosum]
MVVVLFFSFFFLLWLQRRCVPFLFMMLAARREWTTVVRSDGEVEGNSSRWLRAEGSDQRSKLCASGQWLGGRGSGGSSNGCSRGGGLMVADGGGGNNGRGLRHGCAPTGGAANGRWGDGSGATTACTGKGEKEAKEAAVVVEVAGKRRRQWPTMGGSGGWRLELAAVAVKKAGGWPRVRGRG